MDTRDDHFITLLGEIQTFGYSWKLVTYVLMLLNEDRKLNYNRESLRYKFIKILIKLTVLTYQ